MFTLSHNSGNLLFFLNQYSKDTFASCELHFVQAEVPDGFDFAHTH